MTKLLLSIDFLPKIIIIISVICLFLSSKLTIIFMANYNIAGWSKDSSSDSSIWRLKVQILLLPNKRIVLMAKIMVSKTIVLGSNPSLLAKYPNIFIFLLVRTSYQPYFWDGFNSISFYYFKNLTTFWIWHIPLFSKTWSKKSHGGNARAYVRVYLL